MSIPPRPALRYHGGKWLLAEWIIAHFPPHRLYVEPYGGAASVLLQKPLAHAEIYNDLDESIVNVFRVLRSPAKAEQLRRSIALTPFAREELNVAHCRGRRGVEAARRTIIRSFMGFGSDSSVRRNVTGFRANSNRSGTTPAQDWRNWPESIAHFTERLRCCVIECRPAIDLIRRHDGPDTLFYLDPPYLASTRGSSRRHGYSHEMTDEQHVELAEVAHDVAGAVVISGYPCDLYDRELYPDWRRFERQAFADGARERTEVLWLNERAAEGLRGAQSQQRMFA